MATDASPSEFLYDVAFSFLAPDEAIAVQLNEELRDRMRTFLYSEQQKAIAAGAIAGFGKAELNRPETRQRVAEALQITI